MIKVQCMHARKSHNETHLKNNKEDFLKSG
jgi:predicted small metal-binding protein